MKFWLKIGLLCAVIPPILFAFFETMSGIVTVLMFVNVFVGGWFDTIFSFLQNIHLIYCGEVTCAFTLFLPEQTLRFILPPAYQIPLIIVIFFIIGSLVGLIVEKVKNKT